MRLKRALTVLAAAAALFCVSDASGQKIRLRAENPSDHIIGMVSYNTHHSAGLDKKVDYERIGRVIAEMQPDVAGLQEIDSCWIRSGRVNSAERIAKAAGMDYWIFGYAIDFDGGKYGNAIISKEKPLRYVNVPLPGKEEERTMLVAEYDKYFFCVTHLSLTDESRMESIGIINRKLDEITGKSGKLVFLCGDLNATPHSATITALTRTFGMLTGTAKTFPADNPDRTLDYILVYRNKAGKRLLKNFEKEKCGLASWVQNEKVASDHRPISAVVINGTSFIQEEIEQ